MLIPNLKSEFHKNPKNPPQKKSYIMYEKKALIYDLAHGAPTIFE